MSGTFDFCPAYMVAKIKPPKPMDGMSMNGWAFSSKPRVPYQKTFVLTLQGMYWYLGADGLYDVDTDPFYNARRLELFYETNGTWDSFDFQHPHLGLLQCKFSQPVEIPEAIANSGGLIDKFDVQLIHHNPGF